MGGAKLTIPPRGGGIWQGKVSWVKCFPMKNPPDIIWKQLASLDGFTLILIILVVCLADEVCCARLLTRTTKAPWNEFGYKAARRMGEFLSRELTLPAKFTIFQVTFLACFSVICYEKWPVLPKNKKDGLQREGESSDRNFNYLSLINWSIFSW